MAATEEQVAGLFDEIDIDASYKITFNELHKWIEEFELRRSRSRHLQRDAQQANRGSRRRSSGRGRSSTSTSLASPVRAHRQRGHQPPRGGTSLTRSKTSPVSLALVKGALI